jgi:hypothetical protein
MFYDYSGPVWFRNKSKQVLLACRCHELSRMRKHAGNIADGLRCSPWRRAQEPGKQLHQLCGGDKHGQGITALVHPSKIASLQPSKLSESPTLGYLGKTICHFVHDFHPRWIKRLHLPAPNGEHNQLKRQHFDRILRRLQFTNPNAYKEHHRNKVIQVFSRLEISYHVPIISDANLCTADPSSACSLNTVMIQTTPLQPEWTMFSSCRHRLSMLAAALTFSCPSTTRGTVVCVFFQVSIQARRWRDT